MKRIDKLFRNLFVKEKNLNSSSRFDYFIIEKSKVSINNTFHYKVQIQINSPSENWTKPVMRVIADRIQLDMGYHPVGYYSFDLEFQIINENVIQLTWKSWNSCD